MSDFLLYLQLGLEHISDLNAYDHMLFVIALCAIFNLKDWKKVLILITAFTIGHSITLALSVLDKIDVNSDLIETLIPITIIITSITNIVLVWNKNGLRQLWIHYAFALFFGLIHGLGFANYLKSLLSFKDSIALELLSFNIGIELGQIGIVLLYFALLFIVQKLVKLNHKWWVISVSILTAVISISILMS